MLVSPLERTFELTLAPPPLGGAGGYVQLVAADGRTVRLPGADVALPSAEAREVAAGVRDDFFEDETVRGTHVRVLTTRLHRGLALQVARPLDEVDATLRRLTLLLGLISVGGIALAALLGLAVAGVGLTPVRRLTDATEHVARTRDLTRRIGATGDDELGRLVGDVRAQLEELTALVAALVELARGEEPQGDPEPVQLDSLVAEAVERARRHAPGVRFATRLVPTVVHAVPAQLDRAVANLLDNAAKWSAPGGTVEVEVRDGEVSVRDHGPGIAAEDLPHVFERFYRARSARGIRGSGLGLAIVRQVAEAHGGTVRAEPAPGGGARLRLQLVPTF